MQAGQRQMARGWWGLLMAGLMLLTGNALAQRVEGDRAAAQGAYQAEVAVRNQTDGEREKAFSRALLQVLGNVTGDRGAAARQGQRDHGYRRNGICASSLYAGEQSINAKARTI